MKLKATVVAAGLALASFGTFASTFSFDGSSSLGFTFDVASLSSFDAAVTSSVVNGYGFDITSVKLDGAEFASFGFGSGANSADYFSYSVPFLTAGLHTISVTGTALGSSYHGNVVLTPVPEPETYALMFAGLGVMGFVAARRKA